MVVSGSNVVVSVIGGVGSVGSHSVVEGGIVVVNGLSDVIVVVIGGAVVVLIGGAVVDVIGGVVVVGTAGHAPNEAHISSGGVLTKSSMICGN